MKKVIIVIDSFDIGGAEKSLSTLLNKIDLNIYQVDLYVLKKGGVFEKLLPSTIKVHQIINPITLVKRLKYKLYRLIDWQNKYHLSQLHWKCYGKEIDRQGGSYDIAIAWGQGFSTYYVANKVKASRKLAWFNADYDHEGYNVVFDKKVYQNYNNIVAVSDHVNAVMSKYFDKNKIVTIRDLVDSNEVIERSNEFIVDDFDKTFINIVSVGRLEKPKSFEIAILAAKKLIEYGYTVRWYIIGDGSQKNRLQKLINEHGLSEQVCLLGYKANPYPYIKFCDIYCQTSTTEGLGITLIEAKILGKSIVTTCFPTAYSIIKDTKTGLITELDAVSVAHGIKKIIEDDTLKQSLMRNSACSEENMNEIILSKLNAVLNI
ncbi:MAG: glycosyltransferase [Carboxylicivirga sp.]|jgi:glycosyltransferase involved in cell wall biosynthesis|nr:glycosyltransferase [Carboxylicivirga sp.]